IRASVFAFGAGGVGHYDQRAAQPSCLNECLVALRGDIPKPLLAIFEVDPKLLGEPRSVIAETLDLEFARREHLRRRRRRHQASEQRNHLPPPRRSRSRRSSATLLRSSSTSSVVWAALVAVASCSRAARACAAAVRRRRA